MGGDPCACISARAVNMELGGLDCGLEAAVEVHCILTISGLRVEVVVGVHGISELVEGSVRSETCDN